MSERISTMTVSSNFAPLQESIQEVQIQIDTTRTEVIDLSKESLEVNTRVNEQTNMSYEKLIQVDQINREVVEKVQISTQQCLGMALGIVSIMRGIVRLFGEIIDPIWDVIFSIITTTVMTLLTAATAYYSGGAFTAWLGVIVAGVAFAFNVSAIIAAYQGKTQATESYRLVSGMLRTVNYRII